MTRHAAIALAGLAAGCSAEPCAGHSACIVLDLTDDTGTASGSIDQLTASLAEGAMRFSGAATSPDGRTLPLQTALFLPDGTTGSFSITVTAYHGLAMAGAGSSAQPVQVAAGVPAKATVDLSLSGSPDAGMPLDQAGLDQAGLDLAAFDLFLPRKDFDFVAPDIAGADLAQGCSYSPLFCDTFETGDTSLWSTTSLSMQGVTVAPDKTSALVGSWGLRGKAPVNMGPGSQYLTNSSLSLASGSQYVVRFWMAPQTAVAGPMSVLHLSDGVELQLTNACGDGTGWTIWDGVNATCKQGVALLDLASHCVVLELMLDDGGMGTAALYIDTTLGFSASSAKLTSVSSVDFGLFATPGTKALDVRFDDFQIDQNAAAHDCP